MPGISEDNFQVYLLTFLVFVLPGAISIYVLGLIQPQRDDRLKEKWLEAVCFSLINFAILYWPITEFLLKRTEPVAWHVKWFAVVACVVVAPAVWPALMARFMRVAGRRGWIMVQARTAWDRYFFGRTDFCWIVVKLKEDTFLGGRFSRRSYASAYPEAGHVFIEKLWEVDAQGGFTGNPIRGRPGVILRPADYKQVYVMEG